MKYFRSAFNWNDLFGVTSGTGNFIKKFCKFIAPDAVSNGVLSYGGGFSGKQPASVADPTCVRIGIRFVGDMIRGHFSPTCRRDFDAEKRQFCRFLRFGSVYSFFWATFVPSN